MIKDMAKELIEIKDENIQDNKQVQLLFQEI